MDALRGGALAPTRAGTYDPLVTDAAKKLLEEALKLPPDERALLGAEILDSVHDEPPEEVEAAWRDEIKRRIAEIESGQVELLDGEAVLRELRAKYQRG